MTPPVSNQKALAIELIDFEKSYGKTPVLNRLNLKVQQSELLVILGDSGCGKSTLLRLITGLEKPESGTLKIGDVDQSRVPPHRRDLAIVFQDANGYGHLTVRQNLELVAKHSSQRDQVDRWVDSLKLGPSFNQKLSQLSGGQSQRVAIARAMLSGKSIILMDEPLAHLNQSLRDEIREQITHVHRETKRTIVYVTHDSDEAFYLASRVAVLHDGQIRQMDTPQTIFRNPCTQAVGQLLGRPTLDLIDLPTKWFEGMQGSLSSMQECGVRSHDWQINRVHLAPTDSVKQPELGATLLSNKVSLTGTIADCHWMGSHWLLEIDCPQRIRITCPAPTHESLEKSLVAIMTEMQTGTRSNPLGYLEATIERSRILTFGGD